METPHLQVAAVTDEFVRLEALGDSMDKFQAKTVGDMDEYNIDEDEDVNRKSKSAKAVSDVAADAKAPASKRKKPPMTSSEPAKKKSFTKKK